MDFDLARYRIDDEEVQPLVDFLKSKKFRVEWSESDQHFFIYEAFPDGQTEFWHGHGFIHLRKKDKSYNYLEVVYGGDKLANIAHEYYTQKHRERLDELLAEHSLSSVPLSGRSIPVEYSVTIF